MTQTVFPAVILAGGRASRMGGCDKGMLLLAGQSMLQWIVTRIKPQSSALAVNSNRDQADYTGFGLTVLQDKPPQLAGPLAGVLAAMEWARTQNCSHVLTVPVDTPFLPRDLTIRLARNVGQAGLSIAASDDGAVRMHPTIGLWPLNLMDDLHEFLLSGKRKVRDFTSAHNPEIVAWGCAPVDPFLNVNTPDDLRFAESVVDRVR